VRSRADFEGLESAENEANGAFEGIFP